MNERGNGNFLRPTERQREIREYYREKGMSETQKHYKLTRQRIYQIVKEYDRRQKDSENGGIDALSGRIRNILKRNEINSESELRELISRRGLNGLLEMKGMGVKTAEFLVQYASETEGVITNTDMIAWPHAENGLIAACHCGECTHKEWRGNSGRVYCQKTHSWRDADDYCKFAKIPTPNGG